MAPPPALAGCTAGYVFPYWETVLAAFLCPIDPTTGTPDVPPPDSWGTYTLLLPHDGCFGPPLDPAHWAYVQVNMPAGVDGGGGGVCGGPCTKF
jgi:hypothetical protein